MSTYYKARPRRASTSSSQPPPPRQTEVLAALDVADQSIYIFPTPPSLPGSPGGSSVFSAPSDLTGSSGFDARSRGDTVSSHASTSRSPDRLHPRLSSASPPSNSDFELWDWVAASGEDVSDRRGLWELEDDLERASRWNIISRHPAASQTQPLTSSSFPSTNDFIEQHYRVFLRSRAQSNISNLTANSRGTNRSAFTPQPRIHIPLLSFFASLLFLDLEDPALRLLSQSSPDSILFPGQPTLLGSPDEDELVKPHGLLRLLARGSQYPVNVIKDGLAVVCDPSFSIANPFGVPEISAIRKFGRFVGGTWSKGGKAWRAVRLGEDPAP
ncbi:hypothetical protein BC835DRAFT_1336798 [Cytidiella melzeri]|nr:hypothetical protein BC835DRAFT_1336798 [Cytidiella melzeri]